MGIPFWFWRCESGGMPTGLSFILSTEDRAPWCGDPTSVFAAKACLGCRIVLRRSDGLDTSAIMAMTGKSGTGKSKTCVWRRPDRLRRAGAGSLLRARQGRRTLAPPPHEAAHWTLRAMGKAVGLAASTVRTIWKAHGLSPHRWRQFKRSNDPEFAKKLRHVVGLDVAPPAHAVVLSGDETSQVQALDRIRPGHLRKRGR